MSHARNESSAPCTNPDTPLSDTRGSPPRAERRSREVLGARQPAEVPRSSAASHGLPQGSRAHRHIGRRHRHRLCCEKEATI